MYVNHTTRACVAPGPRPTSWIGKAGAGMFSVDGKFGGEFKDCFLKSEEFVNGLMVIGTSISKTKIKDMSTNPEIFIKSLTGNSEGK